MVSRLDQENEGLLMTFSILMMGASALLLGFCIGFVWGELKASRDIDFTLRRKEIKELRKQQKSIPGNVRNEVRTPDAN